MSVDREGLAWIPFVSSTLAIVLNSLEVDLDLTPVEVVAVARAVDLFVDVVVGVVDGVGVLEKKLDYE